MNTEHFPYFCRANFSYLRNEPNDILIELGEHFKLYLEDIFVNSMDKLEPIWCINPTKVILQLGNPMRENGYHPALLLHFSNFIEKMKLEQSIV